MKQTIIILIPLLLFFHSLLMAQFPTPNWMVPLSGGATLMGNYISSDHWGNTFMVGRFKGSISFTSKPTNSTLNANGHDFFILKLDPKGNLIWAKTIGGDETVYATCTDIEGNLIISGSFSNRLNFDENTKVLTENNGSYALFILKLDPNGQLLWSKQFQNTMCANNSIVSDSKGNIFATGYIRGTVSFSETISLKANRGTADAFILKLNSNGEALWCHSLEEGTQKKETIHSISISPNGNIYLLGAFYGELDFDLGSKQSKMASSGKADIFILKLNSKGAFLWSKSIGGSFGDQPSAITVDSKGEVYVAGHFKGVVDLDPGSKMFKAGKNTDQLNSSTFLLKLDASGKLIWATSFEGTYGECRIAINKNKEVYLTGPLSGTVDFNPTGKSCILDEDTHGNTYVAKFDRSGNLMWAASFFNFLNVLKSPLLRLK